MGALSALRWGLRNRLILSLFPSLRHLCWVGFAGCSFCFGGASDRLGSGRFVLAIEDAALMVAPLPGTGPAGPGKLMTHGHTLVF